MPVINIDTDYLREKAEDIGVSHDVIETEIKNLKDSAVNPFSPFSWSSEGQSINRALENICKTLTKLNSGLEEIKKALNDEASVIENDVSTYEPELSQLTDEIKIANGIKPSGSSFNNTSEADSASNSGNSGAEEILPVQNIPEISDEKPGTIDNEKGFQEFFEAVFENLISWIGNIFGKH